jgi:hypothetical protein
MPIVSPMARQETVAARATSIAAASSRSARARLNAANLTAISGDNKDGVPVCLIVTSSVRRGGPAGLVRHVSVALIVLPLAADPSERQVSPEVIDARESIAIADAGSRNASPPERLQRTPTKC